MSPSKSEQMSPDLKEHSPITADDVIVVKDRYLVKAIDGSRFFMKGIAFPNAPPPQAVVGETDHHLRRHGEDDDSDDDDVDDDDDDTPVRVNYNATAWIDILVQLRQELPASALNTVRLYQVVEPWNVDYSEFFNAAAELGFYIMVPLTSETGGAVLNRLKPAPRCYPRRLFQYGQKAVEEFLQYPNLLAGVVGNEVMNSLESWEAAPCVKAYARDLKLHMTDLAAAIKEQSRHEGKNRYKGRIMSSSRQLLTLPLLYAAQDSGIGAAVTDVDSLRLSADYLTCVGHAKGEEQMDDDKSVDIYGINVESWCATYNTFLYNQDGTQGTYYNLWKGLHAGFKAPLIFSEIGCDHEKFNKDTPELRTPEGTRDWIQLPVVLNEMSDIWSGFCAYAYWGNEHFHMMEGGPWNGRDVLETGPDFDNFRTQIQMATSSKQMDSSVLGVTFNATITEGGLHDLPMFNGGIMDKYYHTISLVDKPPTCEQVEEVLQQAAGVKMFQFDSMPTYRVREDGSVTVSTRNGDLFVMPKGKGPASMSPTRMTILPVNEKQSFPLSVEVVVVLCALPIVAKVLLLMSRRQKRVDYVTV